MDRELSLVELATQLLRHRRILVLTPIVVFALAIVGLLIQGRRYSAESVFRPQVSEASAGRFAGLAAQFGVSLPGTTIGDPVKFYAELAKSRDLLREVALTPYRVATSLGSADSITGNLTQLFKATGRGPDDLMRVTLSRLAQAVDVTTDREAGLVHVRVVTRWPELSVQITRRILTLIDESNRLRRQSQAGAERRFVEGRLEQAKEELASAEQEQERFLQQNRRYRDSPQLVLQYNRLQRRVDLQQQVFTGLAQAFEQARIDEVRDTPQLTIIDQPEGSSRRAGSRAADAAMWLLIGCVLGVVVAVGYEVQARQRARHPAEYAELRQQLSEWWPRRRPQAP